MSDSANANTATGSSDAMEAWAPIELSPEQRRAWAQERISELVPREQAAVEHLNSILTEEQHRLREEASVSGHRFGLIGMEYFEHVLGAMRLSDEQKDALAAGRVRLRGIREAVAPHLAVLLDDEQRQQIDAAQ